MNTQQVVLTLCLSISTIALAETWSVDPSGKGDFENIQSAINASSDGDEIVVKAGIYISTNTETVVDYMGLDITVVSEDGPETTIIDGEYSRRGVTFDSGEMQVAILDGFTITNCHSTQGEFASPSAGGGILCDNESSPTIKNCIITNCTAIQYQSKWGTFAGIGGGIACKLESNPTIINCTIAHNIAESSNDQYNLASFGGGIYCESQSSITITDSIITENTASTGAGICCTGSPSAPGHTTIERCIITNNHAKHADGDGGGGIMCLSRAIDLISYCTIAGNIATNGGGIRTKVKGAEPLIEYCTIKNNIATNALNSGGGLCSDGFIGMGANPTVSNTAFCENTPDSIWGNYIDAGGNSESEVCCDSDITGDGTVGVDDMLALVGLWGSNDYNADISGDGIVGTDDLLLIISNWGACG